MDGFPLDRLEAAAQRVHAVMPPTPQYHWPLLSRRVGAETWVKHENHAPMGVDRAVFARVLSEAET